MNEHINLETSNKTRIYISSGCKTFPSKSQPTWNHLVTLLQRPKQSVFWEGCGNKTVTKWSGLSGRSASWKHGCGNTLTFRSFWSWAHLLTSVAADLQPALPPPPLTWLPNRLTRSLLTYQSSLLSNLPAQPTQPADLRPTLVFYHRQLS